MRTDFRAWEKQGVAKRDFERLRRREAGQRAQVEPWGRAPGAWTHVPRGPVKQWGYMSAAERAAIAASTPPPGKPRHPHALHRLAGSHRPSPPGNRDSPYAWPRKRP